MQILFFLLSSANINKLRKKFLFCLAAAAVLIQIKNVVCVSTGDNARDFWCGLSHSPCTRFLHHSRSKHLNRLLYDANLLHCNLCLYSCNDVSVACNILIHRFFFPLLEMMSCWCFHILWVFYVHLYMCVCLLCKESIYFYKTKFTVFNRVYMFFISILFFFHLPKSNFLDSIT